MYYFLSNLEITEKSDPFQLTFNVLHKKPHVFKVRNNLKKNSSNSYKADDAFLGMDCVPTLCLVSTPTKEDNNKEYDIIVLSGKRMFIVGIEEDIDAIEENLHK